MLAVPLSQHLDQLRVPGGPSVLVVALAQRLLHLLHHKVRRLPVGKALAQVSRARLSRQRTKLSPHRRLVAPL